MKQPPIQLGQIPSVRGLLALLLCPHSCCTGGQGCCPLLSTFVTPRNLWSQCLSRERPLCAGGLGRGGRMAHPLFHIWVQRTGMRMGF